MATAPIRRSAPRPAAAPAVPARRAPAVKTVSSSYRGADGRAKMVEEEKRSAARKEAQALNMNMPFRYRRNADSVPGEYVIVDAEPDFFRYEHNLKDSRTGKWSIFCACINESAVCPVCQDQERPSYYAMYLTVIDLDGYEDKDGNNVEWSKKLLVVKTQQQKKFTRLLDRHGTLRGAIMQATRDGDKDASIGNDQEFVEFMSEDDLLTYERDYTDSKGKVHPVIGHEPFDYDALFPDVTEQQLIAIVGGKAQPGSRADNEETLNRGSGRGGVRAGNRSGDDWEREAPATPARRLALRRPAAAEPEEELPEEEAPAPTRRAAPPARGAAPVAVRRPVGRRADPEPEEELPPEDELPPEEEAPRRAAPRAGAAARPAPRRAAPEPEYEEEPAAEEDPPQRGQRTAPTRAATQSLADRRRALRR